MVGICFTLYSCDSEFLCLFFKGRPAAFGRAKKLGFSKIALASDPFQTKMLRRFTREYVSGDIDFIPVVYDSIHREESFIKDPEIDFGKAFVSDFKALPNRENFFERFRGTRGDNIDTTAY